MCRTRPSPLSPAPVSFGPCWLHTPPERVNTQAAPVRAVVLPAADQRRVAVGGERDEHAELAVVLFAAGELRPLLAPYPARAREHPAAPVATLSSGPPISAVLPSAESATLCAEFACSGLAGAGQLFALLGPGRARAREHPGRADAAVVAAAADQRRVAVGGERDAVAELAFSGSRRCRSAFRPAGSRSSPSA